MTPYTVTERGYSALERETVSLLCQAHSNPASQYVWFYNNSQVYTGPQFTITKVLRMHTGDYACLAQNTYLNTRSKKTISLTVYCECDSPELVPSWTLPLFFCPFIRLIHKLPSFFLNHSLIVTSHHGTIITPTTHSHCDTTSDSGSVAGLLRTVSEVGGTLLKVPCCDVTAMTSADWLGGQALVILPLCVLTLSPNVDNAPVKEEQNMTFRVNRHT